MKKFIPLFVVLALLVGFAVYVFAAGFTSTTYGTKDNKVHHVLKLAQTTSDHTDVNYPQLAILLKALEADTSDAFDIHAYQEFASIFKIVDHDADSANVLLEFQVSGDASDWITADTSGYPATMHVDSLLIYKDWTIPLGFIYGRFIWTARMATASSVGVHSVVHLLQQD